MLTAEQILKKGFSGAKVGELIKLSKTWNDAQIANFLQTGEKPVFDKIAREEGTMWDWLCEMSSFFPASSNNEKRKWLEDGQVIVNGLVKKIDDLIPPKIESLVLFPKNKMRCTLL